MKRAAPAVLRRANDLVQPALEAAVGRLTAELAVPVRYHFGWTDARGAAREASGGGKGVRSALSVLSAEAVGAAGEVAVPGGVAVELIHNYSLIHDDIVDDDAQRRHRPTVWKVYGTDHAIIVGDAVMALAFESLLEAPTPARSAAAADLARANAAMIAGQSLDMSLDGRADVSVADCWDMISKKTAALVAHASAVGAILAGAPAATVAGLRRFGDELGRGFQAVDDLLGIWGAPAVTGKPAGSDLRERKRSLPVTIALNSDGAAAGELAGIYGRARLDEADIARAADLVEEAGGRAAAAAAARECMARAAEALGALDIDAAAAGELQALAEFIVDRDY
ncbi:MAG: polyprenyl synthetase family protein [bacterium]|nr:polyprenyl synthetase family protein [bacterium]MCY3924826.1 polyprenyl synthetase family protein [bacterium]